MPTRMLLVKCRSIGQTKQSLVTTSYRGQGTRLTNCGSSQKEHSWTLGVSEPLGGHIQLFLDLQGKWNYLPVNGSIYMELILPGSTKSLIALPVPPLSTAKPSRTESLYIIHAVLELAI